MGNMTSNILGESTGKMKALPRLGGKNLTESPPLSSQQRFAQSCFIIPPAGREKKQVNKENPIFQILCSQD